MLQLLGFSSLLGLAASLCSLPPPPANNPWPTEDIHKFTETVLKDGRILYACPLGALPFGNFGPNGPLMTESTGNADWVICDPKTGKYEPKSRLTTAVCTNITQDLYRSCSFVMDTPSYMQYSIYKNSPDVDVKCPAGFRTRISGWQDILYMRCGSGNQPGFVAKLANGTEFQVGTPPIECIHIARTTTTTTKQPKTTTTTPRPTTTTTTTTKQPTTSTTTARPTTSTTTQRSTTTTTTTKQPTTSTTTTTNQPTTTTTTIQHTTSTTTTTKQPIITTTSTASTTTTPLTTTTVPFKCALPATVSWYSFPEPWSYDSRGPTISPDGTTLSCPDAFVGQLDPWAGAHTFGGPYYCDGIKGKWFRDGYEIPPRVSCGTRNSAPLKFCPIWDKQTSGTAGMIAIYPGKENYCPSGQQPIFATGTIISKITCNGPGLTIIDEWGYSHNLPTDPTLKCAVPSPRTTSPSTTIAPSTTTTVETTTTSFSSCPPGGVWTEWVDVVTCNTQCGAWSTTPRTRSCSKACGDCPCKTTDGNYAEVETRYGPCNVTLCDGPEPCMPGFYETYNFNTKKYFCGPGGSIPMTTCNGIPPSTTTKDPSSCPPEGVWSEWTWSLACHNTCGAFTSQPRTRECSNLCGDCPCKRKDGSFGYYEDRYGPCDPALCPSGEQCSTDTWPTRHWNGTRFCGDGYDLVRPTCP